MIDEGQLPAWIALFFGIYALAAGIGELRKPGFWTSMVGDFGQNSALRFLTGIVVLALGAIIYLANPWRPDDWLAVVVTVIGGWMIVEGALILAAGDLFLGFAARLMGSASRLWAILSILIGLGIGAVGLLRL
ncbi:MAG: hypothetical protein ABR601_07840 [Parasphingopyxis sp.]|nr:hypothetical protein [Sphingomonadales bacterium]